MVLEDHVRKGKKLIPPLLAMDSPVESTTWHVERLPELFWIALLTARVGPEEAFNLVLQMAQGIQATIERARNGAAPIRSYFMSEHLSFSSAERQQVVDEHRDSEWLHALRPHFDDLAAVWPGLPARYLSAGEPTKGLIGLVEEVKAIVGQCLHRHDRLALIAQTTVVAAEASSGHLMFAQGLTIPDLNAIFDYPNSDESRHAAGFVVTTCSSIILLPHGPNSPPVFTWPRQFWNRCYRLQPCEHD
jgi:hypothetical protein